MMVLVVLPKRVHGCFNATPTHGSRLVQHSRRRQRAVKFAEVEMCQTFAHSQRENLTYG